MSIDLPPVPPPPMPRPKLNKPVTIIAGCGLGILSIVVLGVLIFVPAVFYLPQTKVPKMRYFVDGIYAKAEMNKNLTKEQLTSYGAIVKLIDAPEASVFVAYVGGAVLYDHLKDGSLSDDEIKEADSVLVDLQKDPAGGVLAMMSYVNSRPEMQRRVPIYVRDMGIETANVPL